MPYIFLLLIFLLSLQKIISIIGKYDKSSADIRIGDLWGKTYAKDEKGVSALIAFTQKGKEIIEGMQNITLVEHPFEIVAEGQMKTNIIANRQYKLVMFLLRHNINISCMMWNILLYSENLPFRIIGRLKRSKRLHDDVLRRPN